MIHTIVVTGYLIIVAGMIASEIYARSRPDRFAPVDDMLGRIMHSRTARIGMIAAWWWFGWHFIFAATVAPITP
jgi:hypothetical protein